VVDVTPGAASLHRGGSRSGIDLDSPHRRQIENDAVVHGAEARRVVPAAAHCERQPTRLCEVDDRDDVGDIAAAHDQSGMPVGSRVVDRARLVVAVVSGTNDFSSYVLER
jgi:hypothetical protein